MLQQPELLAPAGSLETLKYAEKIKNYGDFSMFPVFGGKMAADGICSPQDFPHKK